jgi:hypothetical protein
MKPIKVYSKEEHQRTRDDGLYRKPAYFQRGWVFHNTSARQRSESKSGLLNAEQKCHTAENR